MNKNIPFKSVVPNMLSGIDYSKLISEQSNNRNSNNLNKEIKGRSLKLSKKINNYHNKSI